MTGPPFTLTIPGLGLDAAQTLSEIIDSDVRFDARAIVIIINDGDERSRCDVVAHFESAAEAHSARRALEPKARVAALPDRDWVRQSLEGLPPITAGRFFLHGSHDRHRRRRGGISLQIDAGTAFGTGHHGTTEGCLLALDNIIKKKRRPARVLDVGCGAGVLAIAAAKAIGTKVVASDIDPEAIRVTKHNAWTNGVASSVTAITAAGLKHPRILANAPYDLIFANILAGPLVSLAPGLSLILAPGGALVLSGLTLDQHRWVSAAYRNRGLVPTSKTALGNWATLVVTQPRKSERSSDSASGGRRGRCESRSRQCRPAPWRD